MTPNTSQSRTERISSVLAAEHLTKEVTSPEGSLVILDGIDLAVQAGEALAILGPSGSGKTTLLALLAGLDDPTQGIVRLLGQTLQALDEDERAALRASRVGFVFQDFQLLPRLTAVENVRFACELAGLSASLAKSRAGEVLAAVGLAGHARHFPATLSGGEKQRVALARAFAPEPEILFADEPTGNLDNANGRRVMDLLFSLRERQRTTLVLATHDEHVAARCGRHFTLIPPGTEA